MSRRAGVRLTLVGVLVLAGAATAGPAGATGTSAVGTTAACRGTAGVTVVADYGRAARGIDVRCAPGDPANGLAALTGAGLPYTFVPGQPGLVCTIKNVPDPCNGAPVTAYWSYWHLRADRTWQFSTQGAGSYNPAPGATEGWAFGAGTPPRKPTQPTGQDVVAGPGEGALLVRAATAGAARRARSR